MKTDDRGFTLIEVVSSIIIIGLALVATLSMFSIGSRSNALIQQKVIAYNLLQRKLEEASTKPFSTDVGESSVTYSGYSDYSLDLTQTDSYLSNSKLKRLVASISWTNPYGKSQTETISMLVADY